MNQPTQRARKLQARIERVFDALGPEAAPAVVHSEVLHGIPYRDIVFTPELWRSADPTGAVYGRYRRHWEKAIGVPA